MNSFNKFLEKNFSIIWPILLNIFLRNFFVISSTLYFTAFFIKNIGPSSWSQMQTLSQGLIFLSLAVFLFIKAKFFQRLYFFFIICEIILLGAHYIWSSNLALIYIAGLFILSADIITDTCVTNLTFKAFSSLLYKKVSPKFNIAATLGQLFAAIFIICMGAIDQLMLYPLLAICIALFLSVSHYMCINLKINAKEASEEQVEIEQEAVTPKSILSDQLLQAIFIMISWSMLIRLILDIAYVKSVKVLYQDQASITYFMTIVNLVVLVCTFIFQKKIFPNLLHNKTPSSLFSILPAMTLVGSLVLSCFPHAYGVVGLNILVLIINKSIHGSISRVCIQSLDASYRQKAVLLLNIVISFSVCIVAFAFTQAQSFLGQEEFLLLLALFSAAIFPLISRFDSFYIKNLWTNFFNDTDHNYNILAITHIKESPQVIQLKKNYVSAFGAQELVLIVGEHKELLANPATRKDGMDLLAWTGLPSAGPILAKLENTFSDHCISSEVYATFSGLKFEFGPSTIRLLKSLTLRIWSDLDDIGKLRLLAISQMENSSSAERLIEILSVNESPMQQKVLLDSINPWTKKIDAFPLIQFILDRPFETTFLAQNALLLATKLDKGLITSMIKPKVDFLREIQFSLWSNKNPMLDEAFFKLLFIEEWAIQSAPHSSFEILKSIWGFNKFSLKGKEFWADLHLEYLKDRTLLGLDFFIKFPGH